MPTKSTAMLDKHTDKYIDTKNYKSGSFDTWLWKWTSHGDAWPQSASLNDTQNENPVKENVSQTYCVLAFTAVIARNSGSFLCIL